MDILNNKVAFITGAASGIGAGMAKRFAQEGARIVLADVQDAEGQSLRDEIVSGGGEAIYVHCDVSDAEDMRKAIDATTEKFGHSTSCAPMPESTESSRPSKTCNRKSGTKLSTSICGEHI